MRKSLPIVFLLLVLLATAMGFSKHHGSRQSAQGTPGVFDYYLLALSWSPEFCYSHADKPECRSGHHGFVVHGLWPQYTDGYPENCSTALGLSNPAEMADLMPDAGLVAMSGALTAPAAASMPRATSNFCVERSRRSKYRSALRLRERTFPFLPKRSSRHSLKQTQV